MTNPTTRYYAQSLRAFVEASRKTVYIVETRMGNNWENCWTEDYEALTFPSRALAQAEINDLLKQMPDYRADDYRIVKVQHG